MMTKNSKACRLPTKKVGRQKKNFFKKTVDTYLKQCYIVSDFQNNQQIKK